MDTEKYYVSKDRLEELKAELEDLRTKKRLEIAERLKAAKDFGDLSENSEYSEAREEQSRVETRIFELEEMVKNAEIIHKNHGDAVRVGSTVHVQKGKNNVTYEIVGSSEANPAGGKISNESPLGQAFMSRKVGDVVEVQTPSGPVEYKILKVS